MVVSLVQVSVQENHRWGWKGGLVPAPVPASGPLSMLDTSGLVHLPHSHPVGCMQWGSLADWNYIDLGGDPPEHDAQMMQSPGFAGGEPGSPGRKKQHLHMWWHQLSSPGWDLVSSLYLCSRRIRKRPGCEGVSPTSRGVPQNSATQLGYSLLPNSCFWPCISSKALRDQGKQERSYVPVVDGKVSKAT